MGKSGLTLSGLLFVAATASSCSPATELPSATIVPPKVTTPTAVAPAKAPFSKFEVVRAAADAYLASDKAQTPSISASDLHTRLTDGDPSNEVGS